MFWKSYFWFFVLGGACTYLWQGFSRSWEVIDVISSVIAAIGFFGFVWKKKIINSVIWKIFFPVYMVWNVIYQYILPLSPKVAEVSFGGLSRNMEATITFACFAPLGVALYLYAFKRPDIWKQQSPLTK